MSYVIIFICQRNFDTFQHVTTVFVEGTFKSISKLLSQMFTVYLIIRNFYIPVVFSLLPSKTTKAYKIVRDQLASSNVKFDNSFSDFK